MTIRIRSEQVFDDINEMIVGKGMTAGQIENAIEYAMEQGKFNTARWLLGNTDKWLLGFVKGFKLTGQDKVIAAINPMTSEEAPKLKEKPKKKAKAKKAASKKKTAKKATKKASPRKATKKTTKKSKKN